VKTFYETNNRLPNYVTINNAQVTMPQFLQLLTYDITQTNSGSTASITLLNVNNPTNPTETVKSGTLTKSEYLSIASTVKTTIDSTGTAPNYATSSLGNIRFESLIYIFSKTMNYYATNSRLPNSLSVTPWNSSTTQNQSGTNQSGTTFTSSQINSAVITVKKYSDVNYKLPSYVTINNVQVTMPQFLKLITQYIININSGLSTTISLETVSNQSSATETLKSGTIYKTEYINLAKSINTYIDTNKKAPDYISSSLGNMKFESMIYTFCKLINYQATYNRLPNYVSITPWFASSLTTNGFRPIYIISDNISNKKIDNERIDILVNALKSLGLSAYNYGAGTSNYSIFSMIPDNALLVQINGGACSGTFVDMGSAYYKSFVGNREVFMVFTEGAKKITGLAWLERAHDDAFSPASFTGLAHPDQYLLSNGYNYYEGYTNSLANTLAQILYQEANENLI
ncbi:MAG: hypothetical protein LLF83_01135, partial [Methanobacterium sp.]|nr:hypothetical protein [Methanobacterium sp.]